MSASISVNRRGRTFKGNLHPDEEMGDLGTPTFLTGGNALVYSVAFDLG
jgi:hypothetical protein